MKSIKTLIWKLNTIQDWSENNVKVGCIAVYAGKIRLIDNIVF